MHDADEVPSKNAAGKVLKKERRLIAIECRQPLPLKPLPLKSLLPAVSYSSLSFWGPEGNCCYCSTMSLFWSLEICVAPISQSSLSFWALEVDVSCYLMLFIVISKSFQRMAIAAFPVTNFCLLKICFFLGLLPNHSAAKMLCSGQINASLTLSRWRQPFQKTWRCLRNFQYWF